MFNQYKAPHFKALLSFHRRQSINHIIAGLEVPLQLPPAINVALFMTIPLLLLIHLHLRLFPLSRLVWHLN